MDLLGYPDVNPCYLVTKREEGPQGRAVSSSIPRGRDTSLVSVGRAVTIQGFSSTVTNPMGLEDRAGGPRGQGIESKRLVLQVSDQWNCPARFWTCLGSMILSFLLHSLVRDGDASSVPTSRFHFQSR